MVESSWPYCHFADYYRKDRDRRRRSTSRDRKRRRDKTPESKAKESGDVKVKRDYDAEEKGAPLCMRWGCYQYFVFSYDVLVVRFHV